MSPAKKEVQCLPDSQACVRYESRQPIRWVGICKALGIQRPSVSTSNVAIFLEVAAAESIDHLVPVSSDPAAHSSTTAQSNECRPSTRTAIQ